MSSSTSSSDRAWRRFAARLVAVWAGGAACMFVLLALLDPWGALGLPIHLPRQPSDHSQRWAYPEIARDQRFDSAIIGDSATRLFNPADLDRAAGAHFANLAMVHAYAWEQARLLDVFIAAHPEPKAVMIGIDRVWCERGEHPERFGYDPIPEWLYDGDKLAALANLLNLHAIDTAWRSLSARLGYSPAPYGDNGYALIGVDFHPYNPALARHLIAQDLAVIWPAPADPNPATWRYVTLEWMARRLEALPASTRKLLVFVPHHHLYPAPGSVGEAMMNECRRRVLDLAGSLSNAEVYDAALPGPVTMEDDRWWDAVHARPETMARVSRGLGQVVAGGESEDVRLLTPQRPASAQSAANP
jgi:hypothetical protein